MDGWTGWGPVVGGWMVGFFSRGQVNNQGEC